MVESRDIPAYLSASVDCVTLIWDFLHESPKISAKSHFSRQRRAPIDNTRPAHRPPAVITELRGPGLKESFRWELKQVRRIPRMDH